MIKIEARPSRLSLASLGRCYRTRLTVDKRKIKDFTKPSPFWIWELGQGEDIMRRFHFEYLVRYNIEKGWASFIRKMLGEMLVA